MTRGKARLAKKKRHSRKRRLLLCELRVVRFLVLDLFLIPREIRIGLYLQHLLGVPFAVRGNQQHKFIAVQLAQGAVPEVRAKSGGIP